MKNPFKNKFIMNFHHADFDGAISGAAAMAAFGENALYKALAIKDVDNHIKTIIDDIDIVLLTDIGISPDNLDFMKPYLDKNKLIIYDHHINDQTLNLFNTLKDTSLSILDKDVCGATLTWYKLSEYYPNNQKLKDLEEIVYFSDVYDMWRVDNPDFEYAAKLNDLLDYQIGYTPDQFRKRWHDSPDPYKLSKKELKIIDTKQIRGERNLKELENNAILFDYKNIVVVITEAKSPTDYIKMRFMNEVLESEEVDMFIFKYQGTTQSSVRIPKNSKVKDLNDLYDDFGCRGHEHAGGIGTSEAHKLNKILQSI